MIQAMRFFNESRVDICGTIWTVIFLNTNEIQNAHVQKYTVNKQIPFVFFAFKINQT